MQHLVRYTMPGGQLEHRDAASLDEATRLVEMAKNEFGATDAQIFREVPIEFKVQYKVTVADAAVPDAPAVVPPAMPATPAPPPVFEPEAVAPAMPPTAQPSEPPPGAMPLAARPVAPTATEEAPDTEGEGGSDAENVTPIGGEGTSRRTLFGRS